MNQRITRKMTILFFSMATTAAIGGCKPAVTEQKATSDIDLSLSATPQENQALPAVPRREPQPGTVPLPEDTKPPVPKFSRELPNAPGTYNPPGSSNTTPGTPNNTFATGGRALRP